VLAVPADSAVSDEDALAEIGEPGVDVVIGAAGVPIGDYTREVLGRLPEAEETAIVANVRSEEAEVKGIVAKLVTGAADAGFVYVTDVVAAGEDLRAIELPADLQPEVAYGVAVLADSDSKDAAGDFIAGLVGGDGAEALLDAGFLAPPESDDGY
jgi:molybdate transport system substrate-binding protein